MLDDLRKPFFIIALVLIGLAMLLELGATQVIGTAESAPAAAQAHAEGLGVSSLALLDGLVILTVGLMAMALLLPERLHGRVQGIVTLVASLLVLVASLWVLIIAIQLITLMLGLLLAPIFGTLAYMVIFGPFDRTGAAVILGLSMVLKLGFAICLMLAHQRFLENIGLVLLVACSMLGVLLVSFLHGVVPGFLVSITDMAGAIVVGVLALVWAIVFVFGALKSIGKAVV